MAFIEIDDVDGSFNSILTLWGTDNVDRTFEPILQALVTWCEEQIALMRDQIRMNGSEATGNLQSSMIPMPMQYMGGKYEVHVMAPEYWKTLEYGQRGQYSSAKAPNSPFVVTEYPRLQDMVKWIQAKDIQGINKQNNRMSVESLASVFSRSIYQTGTPPKPFVEPTLTQERVDELAQRVAELVGQNMIEVIFKDK